MSSIAVKIVCRLAVIFLVHPFVVLDAAEFNMPNSAAQTIAEFDAPLAEQRGILHTFKASCIPRETLPNYDDYVRINQSGAIGRLRMPLSQEQLGSLIIPSVGRNEIKISVDEPVIDVWKIVERLGAPPDSSISIDFDIISKQNRSIALGIGACDEFFAFCNGEPVHGMSGRRDLARNQNLIAISLVPGQNRIKIVTRKASQWSEPPVQHHDNAWELRIDFFGSEDYAYKVYRKTSFHLVDTPIVTALENLRLDAVIGGRNEVHILNVIDGKEYSRGTGIRDGSIMWDYKGEPLSVPLLGLLVVNNCNAEPILVVPSELTTASVVELSPQPYSTPESEAWAERATHLLDPKKNFTRDFWWARKLTAYLFKTNEDRWPKNLREIAADCKVAKINFRSYISGIDGSRQFYRSYSSDDQTTDPILVVSVPGVNRPVRPYLESYSLANQLDTESLAACIEEAGVDLIWPGLIDVDYGGEYAVTNLRECIADAQRRYSNPTRTYLVATCSAGVSSVNFAMSCSDLDGLILNTPEVIRSYTIWNPGLPISRISDNRPKHDVNTVPQIAAGLRDIRFFMQWDLQIPGHGDLEGARNLTVSMAKQGSDVTSLWPVPKDYYIFGEAYRQESEKWLSWILKRKLKNRSLSAAKESKSNLVPRKSVKSALLKGFEIELPQDSNFSQYIEYWSSVAHFYRGHKWENVRSSDQPSTKKTTVKIVPTDVAKCKESFSLSADSIPQTSDALWGFKLVKDESSRETIEIFSTSPTLFPRIDILLSGECEGSIWVHNEDSWDLVKVLE